jgi:peroxisomal membrane protein 4
VGSSAGHKSSARRHKFMKSLAAVCIFRLGIFLQSSMTVHKCGHDSCLLSALRGCRNGLEYAAKIRGAHCLVMILLYRRNQSLRSNVEFMFRAAREHGVNLAVFVFLFKMLRCQLENRAGLSRGWSSFISGGINGALVWGRDRSAINYQVVLYLLSRITTGLIHHEVKEGNLPNVQGFKPMAAFVWAVVMFLFAVDPDSLQGSLRSSMEFLYNDEIYPKKATNIMDSILPFIPFTGV